MASMLMVLVLTRGVAGRHQHIIWTFAGGLTELVTITWTDQCCSCDTGNYDLVHTFVGNDFFCESGVNLAWNGNWHLYPYSICKGVLIYY